MSGADWIAIGFEHLVFAVVVQCAFLFMALLVGSALVDVRRSRYRNRAIEPRIYILLDAEILRRLLDVVLWNRMIRQMRPLDPGTSGLSRLLRGTEQSETAYLVGDAATVLLVITTVATSHPQGAAQILLVGLMLHAYPVLIQRIVPFRVTDRRTSINRSAR